MSLKHSFFVFVIALNFISCDDNRVFDEYKTVGESWNKDSIVSFTFEQKDIVKPYNLFVNLRNNNDYKFSNLYLIVSLEHPNGFTKVDTLEYQMANPDGSLLGDGFSDIKESKLFYKENEKFKGKYKVHIKQAVRENGKVPGVMLLDGITEVGFRIEKKD